MSRRTVIEGNLAAAHYDRSAVRCNSCTVGRTLSACLVAIICKRVSSDFAAVDLDLPALRHKYSAARTVIMTQRNGIVRNFAAIHIHNSVGTDLHTAADALARARLVAHDFYAVVHIVCRTRNCYKRVARSVLPRIVIVIADAVFRSVIADQKA